jgi:peptidoglycan/xylan/chitin deacetylase (PgdA/CDA1 family)
MLLSLLVATSCAVGEDASFGPDAGPHAGKADHQAGSDEEPLMFGLRAEFRDTTESWSRELLEDLQGASLIAGYADGTFRPERPITRAELAALLSAAFPECEPRRSGTADFVDVAADHWAHAAIERVWRCEMMSGYPGHRFGPARSTTRLEAIIAVHGALRGRSSEVDQRARELERASAAQLADATRLRYFDSARIPSWSHPALISATEAGMVILGADREGFDRGHRRVLDPDRAATRADVAALLYGAVRFPHNAPGHGPSPRAGGNFRAEPYKGGALRDGEWVLSFDDGPRASSTRIAQTLRARGVTGLFFTVSHNLGWLDGDDVHLRPDAQAFLQAMLDHGHVIANHTHRHCIRGASCGGRGLAELPAGELHFELEAAHRILRAAIANAGYRPAEKMLHFFRAPGSQDGASWNATAARHAATARLPATYVGTIAWDLPQRGHDISECWNRGLSGPQCAARYLEEIDRSGMRRGIILVHDNFEPAAEMVGPLIDGLRARGMRVVHPRCIVGCTR